MPPPTHCIPDALRDRLDAAREYLHVAIRWVERGDRECCGRDFGFWDVRIGPDGWQNEPDEPWSIYKPARPVHRSPLTVQWPDLDHALARALDFADSRWPIMAE